jgi:hypothetical protein
VPLYDRSTAGCRTARSHPYPYSFQLPTHGRSIRSNRSLFESRRISEATNMVYTVRSRTFASGLALTVEIVDYGSILSG